MKRIISLLLLSTALLPAAARERYGTGLDSLGSREPAYTIFTAVGEDASHQASISWAGAPGAAGQFVRYTTADDTAFTHARTAAPGTVVRCNVYDSVFSKLADNTDVYERHVFDKYGVTLSALQPSTDYIYTVSAPAADGSLWTSAPRRFRTAPGPDSSWRAAVIGDYHHYSPLWSRIDHAMGMINTLDSVAGGVDWILSTGDQCAWGGSYNYWTELSEQPEYKNYMWAPVQGNHDHMNRQNGRTDDYFRYAWQLPGNGYDGQKGVCYWFRYGDVLFLMLNNEAMRNKETLDKARKWIEQVVKANPSRYIVAVEHYEWIIATDGSDSQLERFADLFTRLGVDLAISGNNHAYLRTFPLNNTSVAAPGQPSTVYVVASSSDNGRGRALKDLVGHQDVIDRRWSEGPHTVGGLILDVNPERMILTLHDRTGAPVDSATIPAARGSETR